MKRLMWRAAVAVLALGVTVSGGSAFGATFIQCPGDTSVPLDGVPDVPVFDDLAPFARRDIYCEHVSASDGFTTMADGRRLYMFGFATVTGVPEPDVLSAGSLAGQSASPSIVLDQGQELYLTLTNVGMQIRPDLFDAHTVHFHGYPNASVIMDGVPDNSISVNQGASLTYYYKLNEPGTYMYHCHVEATEHMQMGMMGNLYVRPAQNKLPDGTMLGSHTHSNPDNTGSTHPADDDPTDGDMYAYNDLDASTRYDVEYAIQVSSWDGDFHQASEDVQPLPFAEMRDNYGLINGRGYPDAADARELDFPHTPGSGANPDNTASPLGHLRTSQPVSSLITVNKTGGETKLLLRLNNISITRFFSVATTLGVPMKIVGGDQRISRGGGQNTGVDFTYEASSVMMGGGETLDVIVDVSSVPQGTYFLYTTNLNYLSNDGEDYGGIMTEIVVN